MRKHAESSQVDHDTWVTTTSGSRYSDAVFSERRCLPPASSTWSARTWLPSRFVELDDALQVLDLAGHADRLLRLGERRLVVDVAGQRS